MNKRYQFKNKQARTRSQLQKRTASWVIGGFLLFSVISLVWPNFLTGTIHAISIPFWKAKVELVDRSVLSNVTTYFRSKNKLNQNNLLLEEELKEARHLLLELELTKAENSHLRESLGMKGVFEDSTLAYVLVKPNNSLYDILVLDAGIGEGVRVGDMVRYGNSIIIGEIVGVEERTSKAKLFSTPDEQSEVVIGGSLAATAVGQGGGNFKILLPRDITVKEGMAVRLSNFPRTLIGFVEVIEKQQSDSFQDVYVKSPINMNEVETVFIIKGGE